MQRRVIASAVDVNSGQYFPMDFDTLDPSEYATAILASASFPVAFPTTDFRNHTLMDGGSAWNLNLETAIDKCHQLGYDTSDIVLDAILLDPMGVTIDSGNTTTAWSNYIRYNEIKS